MPLLSPPVCRPLQKIGPISMLIKYSQGYVTCISNKVITLGTARARNTLCFYLPLLTSRRIGKASFCGFRNSLRRRIEVTATSAPTPPLDALCVRRCIMGMPGIRTRHLPLSISSNRLVRQPQLISFNEDKVTKARRQLQSPQLE